MKEHTSWFLSESRTARLVRDNAGKVLFAIVVGFAAAAVFGRAA